MEQVHETLKESKFESEDIISTMPDIVITNILNRLPLGDALGTNLLARNWRFKWTLLTELVFDQKFLKCLEGWKNYDYDWGIISTLLLHIKGPITKFALYVPNNKQLGDEIIHWVLFLSRKGMNEFTLINMHETTLKLPSHLLYCLELKHLKLHNCCLYQAPSFCGFPNLMSLDLYRVTIEGGNCEEFITKCPSLEKLEISYVNIVVTWYTIYQLGCYLPKLQELSLDFRNHKFPGEVGAKKCVDSFPCLKSLTLNPIDFGSDAMLSCVFEMIRASPNLQNLNITAIYFSVFPPPSFTCPEVDNNTMGQLQLQSVVLSSFRGSENEVYLIKYLLSFSPLLKTMVVRPHSIDVFGGNNGEFIFARKLLQLHRASTIAKVDLY